MRFFKKKKPEAVAEIDLDNTFFIDDTCWDAVRLYVRSNSILEVTKKRLDQLSKWGSPTNKKLDRLNREWDCWEFNDSTMSEDQAGLTAATATLTRLRI